MEMSRVTPKNRHRDHCFQKSTKRGERRNNRKKKKRKNNIYSQDGKKVWGEGREMESK